MDEAAVCIELFLSAFYSYELMVVFIFVYSVTFINLFEFYSFQLSNEMEFSIRFWIENVNAKIEFRSRHNVGFWEFYWKCWVAIHSMNQSPFLKWWIIISFLFFHFTKIWNSVNLLLEAKKKQCIIFLTITFAQLTSLNWSNSKWKINFVAVFRIYVYESAWE